jgi:hypothetical protein
VFVLLSERSTPNVLDLGIRKCQVLKLSVHGMLKTAEA